MLMLKYDLHDISCTDLKNVKRHFSWKVGWWKYILNNFFNYQLIFNLTYALFCTFCYISSNKDRRAYWKLILKNILRTFVCRWPVKKIDSAVLTNLSILLSSFWIYSKSIPLKLIFLRNKCEFSEQNLLKRSTFVTNPKYWSYKLYCK